MSNSLIDQVSTQTWGSLPDTIQSSRIPSLKTLILRPIYEPSQQYGHDEMFGFLRSFEKKNRIIRLRRQLLEKGVDLAIMWSSSFWLFFCEIN